MFVPVKEQWTSGRYGLMNAKQKVNFFKKIDGDPFHPTECALWTASAASKSKKGDQRGHFGYNGKVVLAPPLMFHNYVGPLPSNYGKPGSLCVLHKCDTDGRCMNIHHLYLGTHKQNMIDMVLHGNEHNQKLTLAGVQEIRVLLAEGNLTQKAIAKQYGLSKQTISQVKLGTRWGWLK
jgi:hypothetical protein